MSDESEVRHRATVVGEEATFAAGDNGSPGQVKTSMSQSGQVSAISASEDDELITDEEKLEERMKENVPQASDRTSDALDNALSGLSARWRNWVVRGIFSCLMIFGFSFIVYQGPFTLTLMVLAIQAKCFQEIISIGYAVYRVHNLPWFRILSWWFLITSNLFFFAENLIDYFRILLRKDDEFLQFLVNYRRFLSFSMYIAGFVAFVLSLKKKYYLRQFSLFAWTHVTLLIVVVQSFFIIQNIFDGMIWFLVPVSMIICNDIMAYMFGFFFGRTPLIQLSPKKTWEGFIGGAFSTVIFGVVVSYVLIQYPTMVCPIEYADDGDWTQICVIPASFRIREYQLPKLFHLMCKVLRRSPVLHIYPFVLHSLVLSLFASLIGPFGGFFASGFKRAFKIKDFGDVIPGHGGLMDRFDCQLLMGTFVHVIPNVARLVEQILFLKADQQLEALELLRNSLEASGVLNGTTI